jgi:hypothetical protein
MKHYTVVTDGQYGNVGHVVDRYQFEDGEHIEVAWLDGTFTTGPLTNFIVLAEGVTKTEVGTTS